MILRPSATTISSYRARPLHALQVLLLLSLLLAALVPSTIGDSEHTNPDKYVELRCMCMKLVSGVHPRNIQKLEMIKPGAHCNKVEVIAILTDGRELCLDPDAPRIKKIVEKMLKA
ncbi:platelet basic protein isoform X2 [Otolemur garnettii]|uniref:platelet basic protein isoform X2 n=1 Tax=Otolemur garnettii TaxID=30611 RepID=UPI000C7EC3E6|nr:platelet basic protein isoform X2 [Otolemur garnettii]